MWAFRALGQALLCATLVDAAINLNFPFESTQLAESDIGDFSSIAFGNASFASTEYVAPKCKVMPETSRWPPESEWARFNTSVGGRLLKPQPVSQACYPGPAYNNDTCTFLVGPAKNTRFFFDDPISMMTTWGQGATCLAMLNTTGRTCTQGGFPVYVVNATQVKDIQIAVNFARNHNLRLVIKNTGHDFIAKSTGQGALSVWTHYLKGIEFLDDYSIGEYRGPAARVGTAVEAWEGSNAMVANKNFTVAVPLDPSVGYGGGWVIGGGHGPLTSLRGLGADQVLSYNLVTAEGKFLTADPTQNTDLFFALRGGGGSTFGIVTSMVVKAYPGSVNLGGISWFFTTGPGQSTLPSARGFPAVVPINTDIETFWKGARLSLEYALKVVNAGGFGFGDVTPQGNNTYVFVGTIMMPNMTTTQTRDFIAPLFEAYRAVGINISSDSRTGIQPYAQQGTGVTPTSFPGSPADKLFISRLLPRQLWTNGTRLDQIIAANRQSVEMGYRVTTRQYGPSAEAAGYPGDSAAVNPAMRNMVVHCVTFEPDPVDVLMMTPAEFLSKHARLRARVNVLRDLTPESGTYFNEADRLEPGWQDAFWGYHYPRLLKIKKAVDPWNLFWAPNTVGGEGWAVMQPDGLPTQDGPLCQTGS